MRKFVRAHICPSAFSGCSAAKGLGGVIFIGGECFRFVYCTTLCSCVLFGCSVVAALTPAFTSAASSSSSSLSTVEAPVREPAALWVGVFTVVRSLDSRLTSLEEQMDIPIKRSDCFVVFEPGTSSALDLT